LKKKMTTRIIIKEIIKDRIHDKFLYTKKTHRRTI